MNEQKSKYEIPVYAICEVCGGADEAGTMTDGICTDCIGCIREAMRMERDRQEEALPPLLVPAVVMICFWAAVITWRWCR